MTLLGESLGEARSGVAVIKVMAAFLPGDIVADFMKNYITPGLVSRFSHCDI